MKKLKVCVLMGGKSIEKEVSFNSGRTVCDHLDTSRYNVIPIFQSEQGDLFILPWHFLHRGKINDFKHRLANEGTRTSWDDLKNLVDFIYLAMHGKYAEDGTVQGFLEILQIPYLGSKVFASSIGMDKTMQKEVLKINDIDVANGITVSPYQIQNFETCKDQIYNKLDTIGITPPYVVKPNKEGSSMGVEVVFCKEKLHEALQRSSTITPGIRQPVLIEEKIEGMELSCCIITDYNTGKPIPLSPTEIVIESGKNIYDYQQKYMPGRAHEYTPARCNKKDLEKIKNICVKVMQTLHITNVARVDGFLTKKGQFIVVDPNTLTGMGPSSFFFREAATLNINHTQLINHLIETELHHYGLLKKIIQKEKTQVKKMNTKKTRVAVLLGGRTNEKEISLESGRNIVYKLSPQKYDAIPIFVSSTMELYKIDNRKLVRNSTTEIEELVEQKNKIKWSDLPNIVDFVFIALHGGEGENGSIQGLLEMLELPYNGSSILTSSLCMDKFKTNQFLGKQGFNTPKSLIISKNEWTKNQEIIISKIITTIPLPFILKPHDDGCSMMVEKINNTNELKEKVDIFFKSKKQFAMIEEMIVGMELTVGIVGNNKPKALVPSQTVTTKEILSIEEKFLPGAGENQTPAPIGKKSIKFVQDQIESVYKILGCKGYARIDCFYQSAAQSQNNKERLIILEINTLPGMTPATCIFHQAAEMGIKPMDFIDLIINLGFEEHKRKPIAETDSIVKKIYKNYSSKINETV